jgi:N-acetylneuraminic acid mutarotase
MKVSTPTRKITPTRQVTATDPPVETPSDPSSSAMPFRLQDLPAGEWTRLSRMQASRSEMPAVLLGELIYTPGGYGNAYEPLFSLYFEVYDPTADRWERLADLPEGRHQLMAAAYRDRVYLFGGSCNFQCQGEATASWVYDPLAGAWNDVASMPEERIAPLHNPREHVAAVALDGKIYAIAGRWREELHSVEVYDPELDGWELSTPLRTARGGHGAAVLGGKIFVMGGEVVLSSLAFEFVTETEVYDPATGAWTPGPALPLGLHGFPLVAYQGVLFVVGGSGRAGNVGNQWVVWAYKPEGDPR